MDKSYNPQDIESKWYERWESKGYFAPSMKPDAESYCIMIPPPNVTGSLHMGHAFQHSLMDALIRYRRMQGRNTLWQVGTDHAGIATQMVVERQLAAKNITRHDLGREKFLAKVWEWKGESGGTITRQMRRIGNSVDWDRERFTMDEGCSQAVQEVFVRLYQDGLIYRGKRLVNWDPKLHTAISDLEVLSEEKDGSLWHLRYPLVDGSGHLVVATTRPETMLGDTAVAVHPEDARYAHLIGKQIRLPITGRLIPIVADTYVDKDFGSGCVKITPAHDFNDYELGKRHNLPLINVLDRDAKILPEFTVLTFSNYEVMHGEKAPAAYAGLDRFDARKKIIAELESLGLLEKVEPHKLKVPMGDRSGVVIEPWLTDQWYVKAAPLAEEAVKAVEDGRIQFVPKQYENMYFSWMRDIQDWCISRQLWWGHRIPAWYDNAGNVYVGRDEAEVRRTHNLDADISLRQDEDVLDTWFSSALWTFSTLGWPENTQALRTFHPTDVLVTGFDIIFFWVARMIMMTMHFIKNEDGTPQVPFKTVYVTGLIRDEQGQKMSKSKGNVIDPLDMIDGIALDDLLAKRTSGMMQPQLAEKIAKRTREQFPEGITPSGTDALRFTLCALASTGRDINWDMKRLEGYRNFCNKLWNGTRFVLMNTEDKDLGSAQTNDYSIADRWIRSRLNFCIAEVTRQLDAFRFDLAAQALYDFFWNEYCDWYLELTKPVLSDRDGNTSSEALKAGARRTLLEVLESWLRVAHPFMPFITEEIWQKISRMLGQHGETIMLEAFPLASADAQDAQAEADLAWLQAVTLAVRNIRAEVNLPPGKQIPILWRKGSADDQRRSGALSVFLNAIARLEKSEWLADDAVLPATAASVLNGLEIHIPLAGLIDVDAEKARLNKEITRLQADIERINAKLGNPAFADKAPAAVVQKERERLAEVSVALEKLQAQLRQFGG